MKPVIYTFPSYLEQGKSIAQSLNLPYYEVKTHHFPDKESLVTVPEIKSDHVIFCLSLDYPNNKLIELFFACETVRKQGVKRISLVAPYLCYMRQDKSFHKEEAISQQIIGRWFSEYFDDVITVDPHMHRVTSLDEVIPNTNNKIISATTLLGEFIKSLNSKPHLLGPDEESLQWVKQVATICDATYSVATKKRYSDVDVNIQLPDRDFCGEHIIQIDDVISTGHTVTETAKQLYSAGAKQVDVIVTHALFTHDAMDTLNQAKIKNIWSSDSIPHNTNTISLTNLLSKQIKLLF